MTTIPRLADHRDAPTGTGTWHWGSVLVLELLLLLPYGRHVGVLPVFPLITLGAGLALRHFQAAAGAPVLRLALRGLLFVSPLIFLAQLDRRLVSPSWMTLLLCAALVLAATLQLGIFSLPKLHYRALDATHGSRILIATTTCAIAALCFLTAGVLAPTALTLADTVEQHLQHRQSATMPPSAVKPDATQQAPQGAEVRTSPGARMDRDRGFRLHEAYGHQPEHHPRLYVAPADEASRQRLSSERLYVRVVSYDTYIRGRWTTAFPRERIYSDIDDGRRDGRIHFRRERIRPVTCTLYTPPFPERTIPTLPGLTWIELPSVSIFRNDVFGSPVFFRHTLTRVRMQASTTSWQHISHDDEAQAGAPGITYTWIDEQAPLTTRIRRLGQAVTADSDTDIDTIDALLQFFQREFTYDLEIDAPERPLEDFLFRTKHGYCEMFATAFVLMARTVGIPARLVIGYCGGTYDADRGLYTLYADNAHAWAEVYFDNHGWILVDPTPPAAALAPTPPKPAATPAVEIIDSPPTLADIIRETQPEALSAAMKHRSTLMPQLPGGPLSIAGLFAGVVLLIIAISLSGDARHRRIPLSPTVATEAESVASYQQFCRVYAQRGWPKRRGETPREYLKRLQNAGIARADADRYIAYVYDICYGNGSRDRARERRLYHDAV